MQQFWLKKGLGRPGAHRVRVELAKIMSSIVSIGIDVYTSIVKLHKRGTYKSQKETHRRSPYVEIKGSSPTLQSIPSLRLCGAVLLSELMKSTLQAHG